MDEEGKVHYTREIQEILNQNHKVFGLIPLGVPPNRGFEHIIELEGGAKLVITTPYRHPKKYKDEIEKVIKELLDMGHIRPSFFSSLAFIFYWQPLGGLICISESILYAALVLP